MTAKQKAARDQLENKLRSLAVGFAQQRKAHQETINLLILERAKVAKLEEQLESKPKPSE